MALLPDCGNRVRVKRARAFRLGIALAVLVATGLLAGSALATTNAQRSLPTLNHQVLAAVNRFRVAHGLVPLRESAALDRSARQHSDEMG
ncbi:MAG: CAP domain-containing protein, partial [Gaiellaceae bacterium]